MSYMTLPFGFTLLSMKVSTIPQQSSSLYLSSDSIKLHSAWYWSFLLSSLTSFHPFSCPCLCSSSCHFCWKSFCYHCLSPFYNHSNYPGSSSGHFFHHFCNRDFWCSHAGMTCLNGSFFCPNCFSFSFCHHSPAFRLLAETIFLYMFNKLLTSFRSLSPLLPWEINSTWVSPPRFFAMTFFTSSQVE